MTERSEGTSPPRDVSDGDPRAADAMTPADGRWSIRMERRYPHPAAKVWRAVSEPAHLAVWFPAEIDHDARPGGEVRFGAAYEGDDGGTGTLLEWDPPHAFAFTWGTDVLRFAVEPDGDAAARVVLVHTFDDRAGGASFGSGWDECLVGLRADLAGEPAPASTRAVARHEELVARFGLDAPAVDAVEGDTWTVRFERQLVVPSDVAWDLVVGAGRPLPVVGEAFCPWGEPDTPLGTVTEVEPPRVLAYDCVAGEPGDTTRIELLDELGTGHGARMVVTIHGSADRPEERAAAVHQWQAGVEDTAAAAASQALERDGAQP